MAKKTKEHAELTRCTLISSARALFLSEGVTRTTMEQIANRAGYTRGAVHWHFKNKVEIFQAMRDQVSIPMVDKLDEFLFVDSDLDALNAIENTIHELFKTLETDQATKETFIILSQCEYSGEFRFLKKKTDEPRNECLGKMKESFNKAENQGILRSGFPTDLCAQMTQSFITGTIELWIADEEATGIRQNVHEVISLFIRSLRK